MHAGDELIIIRVVVKGGGSHPQRGPLCWALFPCSLFRRSYLGRAEAKITKNRLEDIFYNDRCRYAGRNNYPNAISEHVREV
jgi:hypothetical protein